MEWIVWLAIAVLIIAVLIWIWLLSREQWPYELNPTILTERER